MRDTCSWNMHWRSMLVPGISKIIFFSYVSRQHYRLRTGTTTWIYAFHLNVAFHPNGPLFTSTFWTWVSVPFQVLHYLLNWPPRNMHICHAFTTSIRYIMRYIVTVIKAQYATQNIYYTNSTSILATKSADAKHLLLSELPPAIIDQWDGPISYERKCPIRIATHSQPLDQNSIKDRKNDGSDTVNTYRATSIRTK